MQGTAQITVAICTYNRHGVLRRLVATLTEQTLPATSFEVLIVDNSDNRAERDRFAAEVRGRAGLEVVFSAPPGLSRARNVAVERCRTPWIAFIDDDAVPSAGWLAALVEAFGRSNASVVGGPIEPVWPDGEPDWLPAKYVACLSILDYGPQDREMGPYEFAYGTNIAFRVEALREAGGFQEALGRTGGRTLISDEEMAVQLALQARGHTRYYAAAARIAHVVHANRISRSYFRARMAWQAVSALMHESPFVWADQSRQEVIRTASVLGVENLVPRLLEARDPATFTAQLDFIYHLCLLLLDSKDADDATFEDQFGRPALPTTRALASGTGLDRARLAGDGYAASAAIGADVRHLIVDASYGGHRFLLDAYGDVPGSQTLALPVNAWDRCDDALLNLERSLTPQLETVTFVTAEPYIYGPSWPAFRALLARLPGRVLGIVHRPPWTVEQGQALAEASERMHVLVLAEPIAQRLHKFGVTGVTSLPLHPSHSRLPDTPPGDLRRRIGIQPDQVVFSIIGEARHGKGIELLLSALERVAPGDRARMFFLFAGRARDVDRETVQAALARHECFGHVDLRHSADPLDYVVLTDEEITEYLAVSDAGILLYQGDQRECMSGILPDYVWRRRPVLALAHSVVGQLVERHDLGVVIREETPQAIARALSAALGRGRDPGPTSERYESFRSEVDPDAVIARLASILSEPRETTQRVHPADTSRRLARRQFDRYLANVPLLHSWDGGQTWNTGGFEPEHLRGLYDFLDRHLPQFPRILETGAGNTTITFLHLAPATVVSVTPEAALFERIQSYCTEQGISTDALEACTEGSEWTLPRMAETIDRNGLPRFDFVLIDGCHNWPMVFVDFMYGNFMLKPGGYIMIDDVHLHSVKELARMLAEQPEFTMVEDLGKALIYQRGSGTEARLLGEWPSIPYIRRLTDEYARRPNPFAL